MPLRFRKVMNRSIVEFGCASPAITCTPGTTLKEALRLLKASSTGCLVVAEEKKVRGLFSERDFLQKIAGEKVAFEQELVDKYMCLKPVTVTKQESIAEVLFKLRKGNFGHLVVVDAYNNFEKVISLKDVADYLIEVLFSLSPEVVSDTEDEFKKAA